jgi:hypothetical protein
MMSSELATTILFPPVGPQELDLIEKSGFREFPSRLEGQPFFFPVQNEEYARQIARDWNSRNPAIGAGFVTRFRARREYLKQFDVRTVGGTIHKEYWVPAEHLAEFNRNIVGKIEVTAEFRGG